MKFYFSLGLGLYLSLCWTGCKKKTGEPFIPESDFQEYPFAQPDSSLKTWLAQVFLDLPDFTQSEKEQEINGFSLILDSILQTPPAQEFMDLRATLPAGDQVNFLKNLVYYKRGLQFDSNKTNISNIFPHRVWKNKRGNCIGTSFLLLVLAQELGISLSGVALPGHFFVRFHQSDQQINLEPNRFGYTYSDAEYRVKYSLGKSLYYDLKNLTLPQSAGFFLFNLGSVYLGKKQYPTAHKLLRAAIAQSPHNSEAQGNLGLCFNNLGMPDSARFYLEQALKTNSENPDGYHNLATLFLMNGVWQKADPIINEGLGKFPGHPLLLYDLAVAWEQKGNKDSLEYYLRKSGRVGQP